jgi:hypothetical protein
MMGEILRGPKAAERMEFELFSRLGAQMELFPALGYDNISASTNVSIEKKPTRNVMPLL